MKRILAVALLLMVFASPASAFWKHHRNPHHVPKHHVTSEHAQKHHVQKHHPHRV
jgi:hypothetical protein